MKAFNESICVTGKKKPYESVKMIKEANKD